MNWQEQLQYSETFSEMKDLLEQTAKRLEETMKMLSRARESVHRFDLEKEALFARIWDYENGLITPGDPDYDEEFAQWLCKQSNSADS